MNATKTLTVGDHCSFTADYCALGIEDKSVQVVIDRKGVGSAHQLRVAPVAFDGSCLVTVWDEARWVFPEDVAAVG